MDKKKDAIQYENERDGESNREKRCGSPITARCGYPYLLQGSFSPKLCECVQGNEDIAMVDNNCAIRSAWRHDAGIPHHPLYKSINERKNQAIIENPGGE